MGKTASSWKDITCYNAGMQKSFSKGPEPFNLEARGLQKITPGATAVSYEQETEAKIHIDAP